MAQPTGFSTGHIMHKRIVAAAFIALAVASCQKKASGQTVAVVNNEEITASELNAELASAKVPASAATAEIRNEALQRLINRRLLDQQAKSDGLDKSPEFVSQERNLTENLLINMLISKQVNTSQVPTAAQISQYEADHPGVFAKREIWTLDQLVYPYRKDAVLDAKINSATSLDQIAQALTAEGIQFTRGTRQIDSALFPPNIYAKIMTLKAGEPFVANSPDKAVASVITARQAAPLPEDKARTIALNGMRREQIDKFINDRVKSLQSTAKIQYQPGFGPPATKSGS